MTNQINFRRHLFRGSLRQLLEEAAKSGRSLTTFVSAHEWLKLQIHQEANIFPVRRFAPYPLRGNLHGTGRHDSSFMPCDNEPLADLYRRWSEGREFSGTIGQALVSGNLVASWKCDLGPAPIPSMKFRGVRVHFREMGLKLAHIADAAKGFLPGTDFADQITIRYLRSLSPLNVFLFPSARCCQFRLVSGENRWRPTSSDWSEDFELRRIALGWLLDKLGIPLRDALSDFSSPLDASDDWRRVSEGTLVEVRPRALFGAKRLEAPISKRSFSAAESRGGAFHRLSRSEAVSVEEAVDLLREWRLVCPTAEQLDGRTGSNPDHWLHIHVEGYEKDQGFTSRYGVAFRGSDYNGIINFHGDTPVEAVDRFIELIDAAEDYHDVLRPSATYETRKKPPKARVKPKFVLQGFADKVEGFYLYHDEW